jgi:hypothetical protein
MATPWQGEPALSESPLLAVAGKKRQRTELQPQHHQEPLQQNRSQGASQSLPTTGYDVLLIGERAYTQVLAKALLEVSETKVSSPSASSASSEALKDGSISSSSIDVDRLAIDALQRTLSNESSVSTVWKRRHVHMVESLVSPTMITTLSAIVASQHDGDSNAPSVNVDVDRMNHIVIVVPTAFSPNVWETVPLHSKVQRELDAIIGMSSLRESLLVRQRVSLVAVVGGANDSVATSTTTNDKTSNKAHSYVPMFLCHAGQDASFHCTARQLWKRIAIGTRTDPVSTVSPLLLARKYRE